MKTKIGAIVLSAIMLIVFLLAACKTTPNPLDTPTLPNPFDTPVSDIDQFLKVWEEQGWQLDGPDREGSFFAKYVGNEKKVFVSKYFGDISSSFPNCVEEIIVEDGNKYYVSVDGVLYNPGVTFIIYPQSKLDKKYVMPKFVEKCRGIPGGKYTEEVVLNSQVEVYSDGHGVYSTGCPPKLKSIQVPNDNPYYSTIDGVLFNMDKTTLYLYPPNKKGTSYTVPDSVTLIQQGAFSSQVDVILPPDCVWGQQEI